MPFKKRGRRQNKKAKWRQQKLAVGTIEKIARRVANIEIDKDLEAKWATLMVGDGGNSDTAPLPVLVTTRGMFDAVNGVDFSNSYFAPRTALQQTLTQGHPRPIDAGEGFRIGDEVTVKGLSFKGLLKMPAACAHAQVTVKVVRFSAPLQQQPYSYFASLKYRELRRELPNNTRASVVKSITLNMNHRAYSRDVTKVIDIYVPLKDKKIRYKEPALLFNQLSCAIADFQDEFYMLVIFSDTTHPAAGFQTPIPVATANLYPHLYGRWTCYYKDS